MYTLVIRIISIATNKFCSASPVTSRNGVVASLEVEIVAIEELVVCLHSVNKGVLILLI